MYCPSELFAGKTFVFVSIQREGFRHFMMGLARGRAEPDSNAAGAGRRQPGGNQPLEPAVVGNVIGDHRPGSGRTAGGKLEGHPGGSPFTSRN